LQAGRAGLARQRQASAPRALPVLLRLLQAALAPWLEETSVSPVAAHWASPPAVAPAPAR
jgi:hypothetical protein